MTVKCHDTGVNLRVYLRVCRAGKWQDTYEQYDIPSGSTAVLNLAKPDKKYCIVEGKVESDDVFFTLPPQAFTAAGVGSAEVSLFGADGRRITSGTFYIDIPEECICGCDLESENYIDVMSEYIRTVIDAAENASSYKNLASGYAESAHNSATSAAESMNKAGAFYVRAKEEAERAEKAAKSSVKTVNGQKPDENGNVEIEVGGSGESGAKPFVVTVNEEHMATIEYSTDKTSQEIYQAWVDGQIIVCKFSIDGIPFYELNPVAVAHSMVVFSNSAIVNGENQYTSLVINGSEVYRFDSRLATEEFVNEKIAEASLGGGSGGHGIPSGGKAGQYLCKKSDADYDVVWCDLVIPEQYGLVTYDQDKTITIT